MLTPDQKRRVLTALKLNLNEDEDGLYRRMKERIADCTSVELHVIAAEWNWDDGWKALQAIVEHPQCDAASALQIFWLGRPDVYLDDWMMSCDPEEYDVEHRDLLLNIQERYARGTFVRSGIAFNPTSHFEPSKHDRILSCMREKLEGAYLSSARDQIRSSLW